jgi:dolichol-phosphate mannosyltransferase
MKRVLLTGATGFIGANLARRLLRDGHEVYLTLRPGRVSWRIEEIRDDVRLVEVDLRDAEGLKAKLPTIRPDWIFHLAAYGAYSYQTDVQRIAQTNYLGLVNLLAAGLIAGFEAFINTGTSSEYGFKDHAPAENEWLEPNSYYAVSKAAATMHCRYVSITRGLPIRTLRLYSAFGPYEEPTRLIPTLIVKGLDGELPPLVNPAVARDFVYTEDINDAYLAAATVKDQEPGAVYNVGTGIQTTIGEAVEIARRLMNIPSRPAWGSMPERHWDTATWVADNARIKQALHWSLQYGFEDGLKHMIDWLSADTGMLRHYRTALQKNAAPH